MPGEVSQQDNADPRTTVVTQRALQSVNLLPSPAESPDPSQIEHIRDIIVRQLHHHPKIALTILVFTQQVQLAWNFIPQSDIRHQYLSSSQVATRDGRTFTQPQEFLHGTVPDKHTGLDQEKGENSKESTEEFFFPQKTARSVFSTSTQDSIETHNNFSDLEQDVEHPLSTERQVTTEVVTPKKTLPHPIMLEIKSNFREQINCISEIFPKIRNRIANDVVKMFTNDPEEY
ncbi:uncharacterized protein TNCV_4550981 [Trichonephila clavipes]|uniref:Uncharacterized protein n=1 Tax=Trichonephila clavipes TaxID=2585209 RepID=A0A8X6RZS8_TRICX|nr:uncharacterized protein TNCV_4550981 [Trichonephila clavipes]